MWGKADEIGIFLVPRRNLQLIYNDFFWKKGFGTVKIILKGVRRMRKLDDFLAEQLQDEEFKKEYENFQPEMDCIRSMVDVRTSQN